jgi:predicted RNA-binding Zn ribbon-like protein
MSSDRPSKYPKSRSVDTMRLNAGATCLDFLNTNAFRAGQPREWLNGYDDLLTFAARTRAVSVEERTALLQLSLEVPETALAVTATARAWRETLYRVVTDASAPGDLVRLDASFRDAYTQRRLLEREADYHWTWPPDRLEQPLWMIALDAAELLVSGLSARVRTCPGEDCGWVFLDSGRGKPRRWCVMDLCGNRDKVKRFRDRSLT